MKKQIQKLIEAEMVWGKKNQKQNPNGRDWFLGYMDGLVQARNLVKRFKPVRKP